MYITDRINVNIKMLDEYVKQGNTLYGTVSYQMARNALNMLDQDLLLMDRGILGSETEKSAEQKTKKIEVWLYRTSEPIVHDAKSTYQKGDLYCVYCEDERVFKYPLTHILRVIEGYGTHGGDKDKK